MRCILKKVQSDYVQRKVTLTVYRRHQNIELEKEAHHFLPQSFPPAGHHVCTEDMQSQAEAVDLANGSPDALCAHAKTPA
jgi:hypothetical protein